MGSRERWARATCLVLFLVSPLAPLQAASVDFRLPALGGGPVQLSDYRGKWVIVNFWASWCAPCLEELQELSLFQSSRAPEIQVIGVNYEDRPAPEIEAFLGTLPPTNFPHLIYNGNEDGLPPEFFIDWQGRQLALQALPSTFFIDPQGQLRGMHTGAMSEQSLNQKLQNFARSIASE